MCYGQRYCCVGGQPCMYMLGISLENPLILHLLTSNSRCSLWSSGHPVSSTSSAGRLSSVLWPFVLFHACHKILFFNYCTFIFCEKHVNPPMVAIYGWPSQIHCFTAFTSPWTVWSLCKVLNYLVSRFLSGHFPRKFQKALLLTVLISGT